MSILEYAVGVFVAAILLGIGVAIAGLAASTNPSPVGAVPTCYTFHRAVVVVPAVCAKHDICETAIEAKVCDSILIQGAKR